MLIRAAETTDATSLAHLLDELGYPDSETFIADKIAQQLTHADALLLVAVDSAQVLGFISLHFISQLAFRGDFCRISYLCVDAGARGRSIGAQLEACAEREARARGCDRIELHCSQQRTRAHEFYYRHGYEESPKYLLKRLARS